MLIHIIPTSYSARPCEKGSNIPIAEMGELRVREEKGFDS